MYTELKITVLVGYFLDKPGTQLQVDHGGVKHDVTLGDSIGHGKQGIVHSVTSHASPSGNKDPNHLLVKEFKGDPGAEINHLKQVGQFHGSVTDEASGREHALITKQPGMKLKDTQTYKDAKRGAGKAAVHETGAHLVGDAQVRHATDHGILHKCVVSMYLCLLLYLICAIRDNHAGNVLFEEEAHDGGHRLTKANFVDWGKAEQAPAGPHTQAQKDQFVCYFPS